MAAAAPTPSGPTGGAPSLAGVAADTWPAALACVPPTRGGRTIARLDRLVVAGAGRVCEFWYWGPFPKNAAGGIFRFLAS